MSLHRATVDWSLEGDFAARRYSRVHAIAFEGGLVVPGAAAAANVDPRFGRPDAMDPEQAFVAALSACHMLWFLDLAARAGFVCESYRDAAEGTLAPGADGRTTMTRVTLRPEARFAPGARPTAEELSALHHAAHEACFIANSVKSEVAIAPR